MNRAVGKFAFGCIVLIFMIQMETHAQDYITLMNGTGEFTTIVDTTGPFVKVIDLKSKNKSELVLDKDRVFSVKYQNGPEIVYYRQDSLSEDAIFTVEEMRSYITGERDARARYSSPLALFGSFAIGAASGLILPVYLSPIGAGAGAFLFGSSWIRVSRDHVSDKKYLQDPMYLMGYENAARNSRVQNVLKGSIAGLLIGTMAAYTIFNKE